jgi:hypothetical protein
LIAANACIDDVAERLTMLVRLEERHGEPDEEHDDEPDGVADERHVEELLRDCPRLDRTDDERDGAGHGEQRPGDERHRVGVLLHERRERRERLHKPRHGRHHHRAEDDGEGLEHGLDALDGAVETLHLRGGERAGLSALRRRAVHLVPRTDSAGEDDVGAADGVRAEDRGERCIPLRVRHALRRAGELSDELAHREQVTLRVARVDAHVLHRLGGLAGRRL